MSTRRWSNHSQRPWSRCIPGGDLSLFPLKDGLQRVARLRYPGQVERWFSLDPSLVRADRADGPAEVPANLLGLILVDGAGVRLARDTQSLQRIQNRPALYFQFSCQIINANLVHPSLFTSPAPLAAHRSSIDRGMCSFTVIIAEIPGKATPNPLRRVANHGRDRPCRSPRRISPGSRPQACPSCRCPARSQTHGYRSR